MTNCGTFVGEQGDKFTGVERIAVLRGGGLGDVMFSMPAITALADAYPDASITLLCTPAAVSLLQDRPGPVSEVVELPISQGVRPGRENPWQIAEFLKRMKERHFDLAVQLHGGGRYSNPFLLELGARHTVGTCTPDAVPLERNLPYVYYQHEMLRALEVVGLAGAEVRDLEPRIVARRTEREVARQYRTGQRLLTIHPGATDPRRRWPVERFAEIARRAVAADWQVLVVGDAADMEAAERIARDAGGRSLAGSLTLSELVGVLAESDVVLGNDSGPRHLALAVGTRTVGLYWVGNLINAGPLGRGKHRVQLSWVTNCPVCGVDVTQVGWTAERCDHDPSFLTGIGVDDVWADVQALAV
ncbi:glycosyltransferase family 9 protein [Corynebacterium stationis]|uniref:glycosyltransferase family 9 protein n=1 Tax=Corynebacterium stationis TaxID=1705 RepID=UPI00076F5DA5|nr:glycosyltransferase family 9 protein [Corynebacterium stationis]AMJ45269.1 glycosyl transferase [Corynebacterium stationis]APT95699.1 glycosyl transferase [Corynebacterium stationis]AQX71724.1 glycosyl transferase [Corynebacterium stationis]ASJ19404.1 glycosyl transferase [Corynebacterium stationis]HJG64724.1 glycosyltransferase family 9 protein [Corynebacterium stationis]